MGDEYMVLYIKTLGDFDIQIGEESLLKETNRSYRLFKLFQYFITFRNKKLLPEAIIDTLWEDNESDNPKNMLRAQIFRLRQIIKKFLPEDADSSKYMNITFTNGYYTLEMGELAVIDIDEFENQIAKGDSYIFSDIEKAIESYKSALDIYRGIYLEENSYDVWLVPIRNYYRRLYLKTLFKLLDIYKEHDEQEKTIELCENSIIIEPNEETIHIYLMEAMLKLGQIKNAMSHFEYISSILEKEKGAKFSPGMRDINRKIQNYFAEKGEVDILNIKTKLEDESTSGPLLCDSDYFKFLFNIQKRKRVTEEKDIICLITLNCNYICQLDELSSFNKIMKEVLYKTLRKGDAFSFWNDTQILILLQEAKEIGLMNIEERVRKNVLSFTKKPLNISIKFIPITSEQAV